MGSYFVDVIRNAGLEAIPVYFFLGSGALVWTIVIGLALKLWIDSVQRNRLIATLKDRDLSRISKADRSLLRRKWPLETAVLDREMAKTREALDLEFESWRRDAAHKASRSP